jgi:hypothetical protein
MGKQHLDALSVATGLFEGLCASERTSNIAGIFMNAARDLAGRLFLLGRPGLCGSPPIHALAHGRPPWRVRSQIGDVPGGVRANTKPARTRSAWGQAGCFAEAEALYNRSLAIRCIWCTACGGDLDWSGAQLSLVMVFSERHAPRAQDVVRCHRMEIEVG